MNSLRRSSCLVGRCWVGVGSYGVLTITSQLSPKDRNSVHLFWGCSVYGGTFSAFAARSDNWERHSKVIFLAAFFFLCLDSCWLVGLVGIFLFWRLAPLWSHIRPLGKAQSKKVTLDNLLTMMKQSGKAMRCLGSSDVPLLFAHWFQGAQGRERWELVWQNELYDEVVKSVDTLNFGWMAKDVLWVVRLRINCHLRIEIRIEGGSIRCRCILGRMIRRARDEMMLQAFFNGKWYWGGKSWRRLNWYPLQGWSCSVCSGESMKQSWKDGGRKTLSTSGELRRKVAGEGADVCLDPPQLHWSSPVGPLKNKRFLDASCKVLCRASMVSWGRTSVTSTVGLIFVVSARPVEEICWTKYGVMHPWEEWWISFVSLWYEDSSHSVTICIGKGKFGESGSGNVVTPSRYCRNAILETGSASAEFQDWDDPSYFDEWVCLVLLVHFTLRCGSNFTREGIRKEISIVGFCHFLESHVWRTAKETQWSMSQSLWFVRFAFRCGSISRRDIKGDCDSWSFATF